MLRPFLETASLDPRRSGAVHRMQGARPQALAGTGRLRSRLPLDDDQQAKVEAQIRKIAEREAAERRERRNQRTDPN